MIKITEVTLGKEISEEHKIIEVRILEVDIEVTLEMKILEEVEVGLEKDSTGCACLSWTLKICENLSGLSDI